MNTGKYIFSQLVEFLPQRVFDAIVMKYEGNKYVKHFTCWNQLLVMMFGQLSNRDSLRDLVTTLAAHGSKAYHLGFGKNVTRSNLAKVNERREPKIFEEFAYRMIDIARKKRINKDFEIDGQVYAFDSTTIDLFTSIQLSPEQNRRGLGFDKPETLPDRTSPTCDGVPCTSYGHTGFTGAIAWNDPENQLIYIFLSNRTYPNEFNDKLMKENIRTKIQEIIYESIGR